MVIRLDPVERATDDRFFSKEDRYWGEVSKQLFCWYFFIDTDRKVVALLLGNCVHLVVSDLKVCHIIQQHGVLDFIFVD